MHKTTPAFWEEFEKLPTHIQKLSNANFALLKINPTHPSLHFKKVGNYWSVRIGISYRALAIKKMDYFGDVLVWFWIGSHAKYDDKL